MARTVHMFAAGNSHPEVQSGVVHAEDVGLARSLDRDLDHDLRTARKGGVLGHEGKWSTQRQRRGLTGMPRSSIGISAVPSAVSGASCASVMLDTAPTTCSVPSRVASVRCHRERLLHPGRAAVI